MRTLDERGFTLPELLVATGVMLAMLITAVFLLQPASYAENNQDAERRLEIALLAQALSRYKANHGTFPADIPAESTLIGSIDNAYDLCDTLIPTYAKDIPLDPIQGLAYQGEEPLGVDTAGCEVADADYVSGYYIQKDVPGAITIGAVSTSREQLGVIVR